MLISHRKRFIFTKTVKTAGTSVESYFERYCLPEGEWTKCHTRDESVTDAGIIGFRGSGTRRWTWYHHMAAAKIRDQIGQETWDGYFKFTVVRNPFDKLISGFFMYDKDRRKHPLPRRLKAFASRVFKVGNPIDRVTGKTDVERFRSWIRNGGKIIDRDKYLIDDKECLDYIIRYEELHAGIQQVCETLGIPFEPKRIPNFKSGFRRTETPIRDFYDDETEKIVRRTYAWEFAKFGYEMPS